MNNARLVHCHTVFMGIIVELKNAIRKSIYTLDKTMNFNFEKIKRVQYPYVFFYIRNYKIIEPADTTRWAQVTVNCVLEYCKEADCDNADLWAYEDIFRKATKNFEFLDTKLYAQNTEFSLVDGVLQMLFDLTFYVREQDETELMQELQLTMK